MIRRIALVGASSTGKTTVFELLKTKLPKYEFIGESTRTASAYGFPINKEGTDATQLAISTLHLKALLEPYNTVLDRCYLDLIVYTEFMEVSKATRSVIWDTWERVKEEYTHFIYFPIEFNLKEDGVRSEDREWREAVDRSFLLFLQNIPHLIVTGSPLARVEQILEYIK